MIIATWVVESGKELQSEVNLELSLEASIRISQVEEENRGMLQGTEGSAEAKGIGTHHSLRWSMG